MKGFYKQCLPHLDFAGEKGTENRERVGILFQENNKMKTKTKEPSKYQETELEP